MAEIEDIQPLPVLKLTPENRARIEALDAHLVALDREIKKAEYCEFDVADMKADVEKLRRQRKKILETYV